MAKKNKKKFVAWKPSKHIGEVIIDDIDEDRNNAKAKKIERYFSSIRYQNDPQPDSWLEKPNLQIEICLSHAQQVEEVIQALSDLQLLDKVVVTIRPVVSRPKSSQSPVMTNHTCYVQRLADNTLRCRVCGQKLPSTRGGEIDREQLAREMLLPTWNCRHQ